MLIEVDYCHITFWDIFNALVNGMVTVVDVVDGLIIVTSFAILFRTYLNVSNCKKLKT